MPNLFGIYVHTPFCVHKCSYCDFYSFTQYAQPDFEAAANKIQQELEEAGAWLTECQGALRPVSSVFFGGGTPSLMPIPLLQAMFEKLGSVYLLMPSAEITLEANPETVTDEFCEGLRASTPVNRISLGAQSFAEENLRKLERLGSPESIARAARLLAKHGFANFSMDLIFAIPGQTVDQLKDDIRRAAALGPQHISFYNLTLKPGHALFSQLPSDDLAADLFEAGIEELSRWGFEQYEISNFSRPGKESRHNLLYWSGGDFLGVGPSASSRFFWDGTFHHRKQLSDFPKYLAAGQFPSPGFENTSRDQTVLEATFLELRKNEGVRLPVFLRRYGYDLTRAKNFALFMKEGLIARTGDVLRLTARGRMLADRVTRDLVD